MVPPKINLTKKVRPKRSPNDTTKHEISILITVQPKTKKWYNQISTSPKWNDQTSIDQEKVWPNTYFIQNGMVKHQFDQE